MTSRTRNRRRAVSASLLAMAVARVAVAQSSPYAPGTPSTTPAPANPYAGSQTNPSTVANLIGGATSLTLNGTLPNGGFVVTDSGGGATLQYLYMANNSTPILVGPASGIYQNSSGAVSQTYKSANVNGSVTGQVSQYVPGSTSTAGYDTYLYIPSVQASTGSDIMVGTQGALGRVNLTNAPDNSIYYSYNASTTVNGVATPYTFRQVALTSSTTGVTSTPTAINANSQIVLQAYRYTGTSAFTTNLGQDAFLFTPSATGSATGTVTQVGLTGNNYFFYNSVALGSVTSSTSLLNASGGAANATAYQTSTSAPIALNNAGVVVGTTTRYLSNTAATASTSTGLSLGTDTWVYSGATTLGTATGGTAAIGTLQVGLAGTTATNANGGGYYSVVLSNGGTTETSSVAGVSAAGAVTGTAEAFQSNTSSSTSTTFLGFDAWQFKPTLAGGSGLTTATAPAFGTTAAGTYVQLGLTTIPSGTTVGYIGPSTLSVPGSRNSTVSAVNAAGMVAGTSQRYFAGATSASGSDAWYYNGSGGSGSSVLITPTANAAYSNYAGTTGFSISSVVGMSAAGLVAGVQTRYLPTATATSNGADVFVYNPAVGTGGTTTVIASPAILANDADFSSNASIAAAVSNTEYFSASIKSVSDTGLVLGTFTATTGNSSSAGTSLGTYLFGWTQQAGTVVLGSTSNTSSAVASLTLNTSSGTTNINVGNIYADAAGDIFGIGYLTGGTTPDVYEFAAAPEPTSLALLAAGLAPLVGRRRRR